MHFRAEPARTRTIDAQDAAKRARQTGALGKDPIDLRASGIRSQEKVERESGGEHAVGDPDEPIPWLMDQPDQRQRET